MRLLTFLSEALEGRSLRPIDFLQPMLDPFRVCEPLSDYDRSAAAREFVFFREKLSHVCLTLIKII
jgi:hypothetical protein